MGETFRRCVLEAAKNNLVVISVVRAKLRRKSLAGKINLPVGEIYLHLQCVQGEEELLGRQDAPVRFHIDGSSFSLNSTL